MSEVGNRTRRRPKRTGLCRGRDVEVGVLNSEVGPVVVPKGWDYAAASMRMWEY